MDEQQSDIDVEEIFAEKMKAHEIRLKHIETATQVEHEIQNSIALPLILEVARKEADDALSKLAEVDPTDTKKIISLQAMVYRSKMLISTLIGIRNRGVFASKELLEQGESDGDTGE